LLYLSGNPATLMPRHTIPVTVLAVALVAALPNAARAAELPAPGFEIGLRFGYAFAAGNIGAPPNGTDEKLSDFVSGQWPVWVDLGYRFTPNLYLGGLFQYGFGAVNEDEQDGCRNANVNCSASDVRLGVMGRYQFAPTGPVLPWLGLGVGYEWGSFSVHQSVLGDTSTDVSRAGFEFANFQAGADYYLAPRVTVSPFISVSIGQYQSVSTTTTLGMTTTTSDEDLAKKSLHEWIMIGLRFGFMP
jgi:opacity protein-like surface antigen